MLSRHLPPAFLLFATAVLGPATLVNAAATAAGAARPNIIFIITDDQRHDLLGLASPEDLVPYLSPRPRSKLRAIAVAFARASNRQWVRHEVFWPARVLGEEMMVMFLTMGPTEEMDVIRREVDQMSATVQVP